MQMTIHAPFEVNCGLKKLIHDKIEKLKTFCDRIQTVDVYLKLKESTIPNGKTIEVNLHLPNKDTFAKDTSDSFEKAVALVTAKLEKQLKKRKEILTKKH